MKTRTHILPLCGAALISLLLAVPSTADTLLIDEDFQSTLYDNGKELDNTPGATFDGWTFWKSGSFPWPKARRSDGQSDFTGSTTIPNQGIQLEWTSQAKAWNDTSHNWSADDAYTLSLNATPQSWNGGEQRFIDVGIRETGTVGSPGPVLWTGQAELPLWDSGFGAGNDWQESQKFSWDFSASAFTAGTEGEAITLTITSSGFRGLFFDNVQLGLVGPATTFPLTITPNAANPGNYDFAWGSQDGKFYDLVSATDLSTAPDTWPVYLGNADIEGTAPTNTLLNVAGGADPERYFAVLEKDPPPLLDEGFEDNDGGFTVSTPSGTTVWAHGDPNSTDDGGTANPGGSVTEGNDGSTNCWGTDIGNPGYYANPTNTCLRSTVVDLTGVTAAELSFAQAIDLDSGDSVTVNIIDDTTDTPIESDIITITDGDINTANWESVGPVAIPAAALGQAVRIEWCLNGTGGTSFDFMGWYIDDVVVEDTSP